MPQKNSEIPRRPDADRRLRQNNRIARVLRVLQLIQGRGRWRAADIAADLECTERTIYRDLQVLEMAGIPWMFDRATGSYRVRPGFQFPVLNLTDEELLDQVAATAVANSRGLKLGSGAKPTAQKLAATLSANRQQLLEDAERVMTVLDLKLADHSRSYDVIRAAQWALLKRTQVSGQYASPYHSKPVKLVLHPYRLCFAQQAWYLIGRPVDRDQPRTYRVTRFKSLRTLATPANIPEDFNLKAYLGNAWGIYRGPETHEVEIMFTSEAAPLVTESTWHASQKIKRNSDGTATLSFRVDGLEEILWWIVGWSGRAKVIQPEKLRTMVVEQLRTALQLNEGNG